MSKVMLAHLVSHFPLTSAIFNKDVQPIHSVKPFSLRCSSYSPDFPQKPVSPAQRLSPQPNKALQGTAELWGPFYRKYVCVRMDTCVCMCAWAGGELFKVYSLKNSVRQLSCCSKGFWGVKTAPACVRRLLGKQDMVGRQQWHTCLRKRMLMGVRRRGPAQSATSLGGGRRVTASAAWEAEGPKPDGRVQAPPTWAERGDSVLSSKAAAGARRARGSPSATPGITDKGMEKGFLLCNTGYHR